MYGLRYESHNETDSRLPFIFTPRIKITATRFSNDANWHENLEVLNCPDGEGFISLDGEISDFCCGDTVVVNTNVIHHVTSAKEIFYNCLIIDRKFCEDVDIHTRTLQFDSHFRSEEINRLFLELERVYGSDDVCRIAKMKELVLRILIHLREDRTDMQNMPGNVEDVVFERIKSAIKYIRENYFRKMSLEEIAAKVSINKFLLSREFKRMTGKTVVQYINSYRCKKAKELISEGMTVAEAAKICGFDNMSFFTRTFKKYVGDLPSKYK
jgi:AraC-like DNA-binding protein